MKRPGESNLKDVRKQAKAARQGLGRTGERLAAEELVRRGYRIVRQNFRCKHGEIDLVAEDEQDLIFVEVKTRRGQEVRIYQHAVSE